MERINKSDIEALNCKPSVLPVHTHDDRSGLNYILVGDYYIPVIIGQEEDSRSIGKWGRMHMNYLKEHRSGQYVRLVLSGMLNYYLADLNDQAQARLEVIGSIEELDDQISALRSERNALHAAIRQKQNRMKEINQLRQAIRDYRRTKDVYAQYKASGWSPKFYNEHRTEIEDHKKAQAVYSSVEGKMPTLKELSTEYEALKSEKEADDAALEGLKPKLTTLNHIKYNFDVLERDYLPEEKDLRREENPER